MNIEKSFFSCGFLWTLQGQRADWWRGTEWEKEEGGLKKEKEKKRHSKMKGQQKKRGNYCSFLMEIVMKWDMGLRTIEATGRLSVTV